MKAPRATLHRMAVLCTVIVLGLSSSPVANAQVTPGITPATSPASQRLLEGLRTAIEEGNWAVVLGSADEAAKSHARELFEVEPGWLVNGTVLHRWCIQRALNEAPAEYQRRVQQEVQSLAAKGNADSDNPEALAALAENYPGTPQGDAAALALGDQAWRNGKLDEARRRWLAVLKNELPPMSADGAIPSAAAAMLRLGTCDVVQGRLRSAGRWHQRLASRFPDIAGRLGDREGMLAGLLGDVLEAARRSEMNDQNNDLELLRQLHRMPLNEPLINSMPAPRASCVQAGEETLIVSDWEGVRALQAATGQPAWPTSQPEDRGLIYAPVTPPPLRAANVAGLAFSGTIRQTRWYGCVDPSAGANPPIAGFRRLISIDLQAEGRLHWVVDTNLIEEAVPADTRPLWLASSILTGPPIADDGFVYAPLQAVNEKPAAAVIAVDNETGRIAQLMILPGELIPASTPVRDELLAIGDLLLWLHGEWLTAWSMPQGAILWVRRVENSDPRWSNSGAKRIAAAQGRLCLTAGRSVSLFDPGSGTVIWSQGELSPLSGIVGDRDDVLVVSGEHAWGLDLFDGTVHWRLGTDEISREPHDVAAIPGRSLLWMHARGLWIADATTGSLRQRIPAEQLGVRTVIDVDVQGNLLRLMTPRSLTTIEIGSAVPAP